MATVTASSILAKVELTLQDTTNVRWTEPELLGWLNDAQREVSAVRPDACSKLTSVATVAGTRQSIPSDGISVLRIVRNMGAAGTTPGRVIRKVPMELLDSTIPDWHSAAQVTTMQHFCLDLRNPRTYYLYPPSAGTTQVELLYSTPPNEIPAFTATGTYSQTTTVVTVTLANHGYQVGSWVKFTASTGSALPGVFQVVSVPTTSTFTFTASNSATNTGNCTLDGVINVDDVFAPALVDYVCFRAYTKDLELAGNAERAGMHRKFFQEFMQGRTAVDTAVNVSKDNFKG